MTNFRINFTNNTIEMTKAVAQRASKYGSNEYRELQQVRADFPTFTIDVVANSRRKTELKGLTYDFMREFIKNCKKDNKEEIKKEFESLTKKEDGVERASYVDVRKWFLATFPEIEQSREDRKKEIANILANVA